MVRAGGEIALPSPTDKCARFRHWIEPPRGAYPQGQLIVAFIRYLTLEPRREPYASRPH